MCGTEEVLEGLWSLWIKLPHVARPVRESWIRGGPRTAGLYTLAGLLDYEDTRQKTSSRVRMGLSLAWKASLAIWM